MTERAEGFPALRPGETVTIEPQVFGEVHRTSEGQVSVEARSKLLTLTVRGHGRIWDDLAVPQEAPLTELARLIAVGLEIIRWTRESGKPEPGITVWNPRGRAK